MMRHFRPVKPGDKIRPLASEWNDVRQTSVDFRFGNPNPSDPSSIGGAANPVVKVRNDQPDDVPAYGVLAVTGPLHESDSLYAQMAHAADRWIDVLGGPPTGDVDEILCIPQHFARAATSTSCIVMGPTPAWVYVNDTSHLYARAIPENVQMLESAESGPVRLMYAPSKTGLQIIPVLLGMPVVGESPIHAKELFPAVVYRRYREERIDDETVVQVPETFVVCPGGRGTDRSIKTVHVLHVEGKTVSTSLFGALPVAANNFGAVLADDGFGGKILVCAPGEVDEGSWYPVQRYSFAEQEWVKTNSAQSLAGCPAYLLDGEVRIAGGQGGYSVSDAVQLTAGNPMTGKQAEYGHLVTPLWKIDAATGVLDKRTPLRRIVSGFSPSPTCYTVDQEKRFLKQNFSGIPVARASDGLSVEFLAVGGTELLGYQSKACVSYRVDSTYGPYVDCETNPTGTVTKCEIFPDTPVPLGECCAVRVTRRRSGTMSVDGDWLVCIGGRYRNEVTEEITLADGSTETVTKTVFRFHERPWSLNLDDKTEGWKNDLFPAIPTPRYNAALSEVVTTTEPVLDENGNLSKETREIRRVFLIGGRTENGLTATIEALNLDTNAWETDWPGLDRRFPPKEIEE